MPLARYAFFHALRFHRIAASSILQGCDPKCFGKVPAAPATPSATCGDGGPGFQFAAEPVHEAYVDGCVAMANSWVNTNGSQFFICTANDTTALQPLYNLFGKVESGMDVALKIAQCDLMKSITVREQT